MKKYNTKITWVNIIEILIGRIVIMSLISVGIILTIVGLKWFIEIYLMQHTIARVIFYIISAIIIIILLRKEFKR